MRRIEHQVLLPSWVTDARSDSFVTSKRSSLWLQIRKARERGRVGQRLAPSISGRLSPSRCV